MATALATRTRTARVTCLLLLLLLCGISRTDASTDPVYAYLVAFMNITTDTNMAVTQDFYVSTNKIDVRFRAELPFDNVDLYLDLNTANNWRIGSTVVRDLSASVGEGANKKALRFSTNHKVNIQVTKETSASTDGVYVLPLTEKSTQFFVPAYTNLDHAFAGLVIASAQDNNCVEIRRYLSTGTSERVELLDLQEFDVFQLMTEVSTVSDITGYEVSTSGPAAVFGGHECAEIPKGMPFCDHIYAQVPPVSEWGTDYVVPPIMYRKPEAGYEIRVLSQDSATLVTCACESSCGFTQVGPDGTTAVANTVPVMKGRFVSCLNTNSADKSMSVTCSKPCLVVQYNRGWRAVANDKMTDPFMTIIPAVDHYDNDMTYSTPYFLRSGSVHTEFYNALAIIVKTTDTAGVLLDGQAPTPAWIQSPLAGYSYTSVDLIPGYHTLVHTDPAITLMGIAYGHSHQHNPTAYGMPTGYKMLGKLRGGEWDTFFDPTTASPVLRECSGIPQDQKPAVTSTLVMNVEFLNQATGQCRDPYEKQFSAITGQMVTSIRQLMCSLTVCQDVKFSYPSRASNLFTPGNKQAALKGAVVTFVFESGLDEKVDEWLTCKRQVERYLLEQANWPVAKVTSCPELDVAKVAGSQEPQLYCDMSRIG